MKALSPNGKILCILAALALLPAAWLPASGKKEMQRESHNFFALGTACTVTIHTDGKGRLYENAGKKSEELFRGSEEIINGIEQRMSVNIASSEVNMINDSAGKEAVKVSGDLLRVIETGLEFSGLSGGRFDISIGPLVSLWKIGQGGDRVPRQDEIDTALSLTGFRDVEIDAQNGSVLLKRNGMMLEPGGVAKGLAADSLAAYLESEGVSSGIINLGGNVLVIGRKPDGNLWRIGVQNPDSQRGEYIGIIPVENKAVVSSGKYERFFIENGIRYHHILSTETGYPIENGIAQVSIIADSSMRANAMSTTVFSMGLEEGLALAESLEDIEAVIVTESGEVYLTSGLMTGFELIDLNFRIAEAG